MEFRHFYYFIHVADEKSFTAAARKLHVSQPSLSKMIQNLESEINAQLISRTTNKFSLTKIGKELYKEGKKIITMYEDLENYISDLSHRTEGTINLGIPPIINTVLLPSILPGFRQAYPQIDIAFVEDGAKAIEENLKNETIDTGIVIKPVNYDHFNVTEIIDDRSVLILHKTHHLASKEAVTIQDLKNQKLVLLNEKYKLYHNIIEECRINGFKPDIPVVSPNWDFLLELVILKQGITILPRPIVEKFGSFKNISYVPFEGDIFKWEVIAITKKNKIIPYRVKMFLEYLKENVCWSEPVH